MNPLKLKLHWQILIALVLALVIGVGLQATGMGMSGFAHGLSATCEFIGTLFMNALKMIMVP